MRRLQTNVLQNGIREPAMPRKAMWRIGLLGLLLAVAGCATHPGQRDGLERNQYAWAGAIRWGDFEAAQNLIDPLVREKSPLTQVELERYKQVQISSYRDIGANSDMKQGTAVREIEIGVINRHTQSERSVRYREHWRWDDEARIWWLTSELPNLWEGE